MQESGGQRSAQHQYYTSNEGRGVETKDVWGKQDAQEIENFLWSMERYFEATYVQGEQEKVNIMMGYLEDHATAWWQRKHAEIMCGICIINTWDLLKYELKKQFYLRNVEYEDRKKVRQLKHTGSILKYVDEFSTMMLQIDSMNSDDLLFNFMKGLQLWVQLEIQRHQVNDFSMALIEVNTLLEFRKGESSKPKKVDKPQHGKCGGLKVDKSQHHDRKEKPLKKTWPEGWQKGG